jgi:hypothetical protein
MNVFPTAQQQQQQQMLASFPGTHLTYAGLFPSSTIIRIASFI